MLRLLLFSGLLLIAFSACSDIAPVPLNDSNPPPPAAETDASLIGLFVDKGGQQTSGAFTMERDGSNLRLVLSDDFQTDEGPDLHVVLTPTATADAANGNVMPDGARVVGPLAAQSGRQVYDLPGDTNLDDYQSVVIHCIRYSHLYGAAPLR